MSDSLTSQRTSVEATFDVSNTFDITAKKESVNFEIPWKLENIKASFTFYPAGDTKTTDDKHASGYIALKNSSNIQSFPKDARFVTIQIKCGDSTVHIEAKSITKYSCGWGRTHLFSIEHIKKYKEITVTIHIDQEYYLSKQLRYHHCNKLESLYKLATQNGDIKLIPCAAGNIENAENQDDNKSIVGIDDEKQEEDEAGYVWMSSLMLMNASKVFSNMLSNDMKESMEKVIKIPCESVEIIDDMIYFIVTGILRADASIFELVKLAHCYELTDLFHACLERMVGDVDENDFVRIVRIFEEYKGVNDDVVEKIYAKLLNYFHRNKTKLLKNIQNINELPFCFKQWSDFMDNVDNYKSN